MKNNIKELRKKSAKELYKELKEAQDKLLKLKMDVAQAKVKNHRELPRAKKNIAKILTIVGEKHWEEFNKQSGEKDG